MNNKWLEESAPISEEAWNKLDNYKLDNYKLDEYIKFEWVEIQGNCRTCQYHYFRNNKIKCSKGHDNLKSFQFKKEIKCYKSKVYNLQEILDKL